MQVSGPSGQTLEVAVPPNHPPGRLLLGTRSSLRCPLIRLLELPLRCVSLVLHRLSISTVKSLI